MYDPLTAIMQNQLHWLTEYKLGTIVYRFLHNAERTYIAKLFITVDSIPNHSHLHVVAHGNLFTGSSQNQSKYIIHVALQCLALHCGTIPVFLHDFIIVSNVS